jgi:hypothetical protein
VAPAVGNEEVRGRMWEEELGQRRTERRSSSGRGGVGETELRQRRSSGQAKLGVGARRTAPTLVRSDEGEHHRRLGPPVDPARLVDSSLDFSPVAAIGMNHKEEKVPRLND